MAEAGLASSPDPEAIRNAAAPAWDLQDLYAGKDDPEIARDLDLAKEEVAAFSATLEGRVVEIATGAGGAEALEGAIARYEAIRERLGKLASYAGLLYAANTADPAIAKFYGDLQGRLSVLRTGLIFFGLELNAIPDESFDALIRAEALSRYRPWLLDLRKEKPHELSPDLEKLLHEKHLTGRDAWVRFYEEAQTRLKVAIAGEQVSLEVALDRLSDPSQETRKAAGEAVAEALGATVSVPTTVLNTIAKDCEIEDRWRGFEDVADHRHLQNRVERSLIDALTEAVTSSYADIPHRYYRWKAAQLGMDQLNYWDRNAPLPEAETREIPWGEARATVLGAYRRFSPEMAAIAQRFFDRGWIDAEMRDGKAPGAFSHSAVPSVHPYVFLNYQGKPRDVMTLAHELGHGVHQVLAADQGLLLSDTPLTLAETASVFGEMLTFRSLLAGASDDRERRILLASKLEDMINTVVRQIAFYAFERRFHLARREGELTSEDIGAIWMGVQAESLGPAIRLNPGYETYWSYIPHFVHTPFYVYAYAFGDCLVNALYASFEAAEDGFQAAYLDMLRAGGSKHHTELLAPFRLDASDPAFWNRGLDLMRRMMDDLEALS